jgi:transcriptional regulator with XRE-family HTH domain
MMEEPADDEEREFLSQFAMRIKLLRVKQRMSQEELAVACGMSRTFLGQLERGQHGINVKALPKLAKGLGVSVRGLFVDEKVEDALRRFEDLWDGPQ